MTYSFDRPRQGFEGINNGGEIYGSNTNSFYNASDTLKGDGGEISKLLDGIDMTVDEPEVFDKEFQEKKEKIINTLNNHFGFHNLFSEINYVADEDFKKIIEVYEQEASKNGKNPWSYLYFDDLIIMQKSVYEALKDNYKYDYITDKVSILFENELDRRLQKPIYSYGEETGETYKGSYAEMPEYSTTLAEMCVRSIQKAEKNHNEMSINKSQKTYENIKKDFITAGISFDESKYKRDTKIQQAGLPRTPAVEDVYGAEMPRDFNMRQLHEEKQMVEPVTSNEKESLQKEIEILNLKQQINLIENERLELEKRIKTISSETLGSYFSTQIEEQYPNEYSRYMEAKNLVRNHRNSSTSIEDIKEKLTKVNEELNFYKSVLPMYETFYQRFEQVQTKKSKVEVNEKEQERIYNLIYSDRNNQLKASNSLYTAWDLGDKKIPIKYQGLTYDQVEALLHQEQEKLDYEQKHVELKQKEEAAREDLINKAIRKDLNVASDYYLSDVQIKNLRVEFDKYTNEQLKAFISGIKKESTVQEKKDNEPRKLEPLDLSSLLEENENRIQKENLINELLENMYPNGVDYVSLPDIKKQLEAKSIEELQSIMNQFGSQDNIVESSRYR